MVRCIHLRTKTETRYINNSWFIKLAACLRKTFLFLFLAHIFQCHVTDIMLHAEDINQEC